jgi:CHAT domain-containing protein/tetratricopeptide (TPR) repeat protein
MNMAENTNIYANFISMKSDWLARRVCAVISMLLLCAVVARADKPALSPRTPVNPAGPEARRAIEQAQKLSASGDAEQAIAVLGAAEATAKGVKDWISEGAIALCLSALHNNAGDGKKSNEDVTRALVAYRSANDAADMGIAFTELGMLEEHGEDSVSLLDPISDYRHAAEEFEKASYFEDAAFARTKLGQMWQRRGRLLPAIDAYTKAIELSLKPGGTNRPNCYGHCEALGLAYAGLGSTYASAGNYKFARYLLGLNVNITPVHGTPLTYAAVQNEYARIDNEFGDYADALQRAGSGLEGARIVGERRLEAQLLFRRGVAKAWLHQAGSDEDLTAAGEIANELHDEHLKALRLLELARLARDPMESRTILGQSISRFQRFPDAEPYITALELYGEKCARMDDLSEAEKAFELAATRAEEVADDFPKLTDMRMNYYRDHRNIFNGLIDLYLHKNDLASAYWWIQIKKARGVLDASSLHSSPLLSTLSADEMKALTGIQEEVAQLGSKSLIARLAGKADPMSQNLLAIREMELDSYVNTLYSEHTEAKPAFSTPLADLQYLPHILAEDTAILEYATLDTGDIDRTVLLVISMERGKLNLQSYVVNGEDGKAISTRRCSEKVREYRTACTIPAGSAQASASEMYQLLIAQAAGQIKGKRRLLICPDGPLWGVPFQSLRDRDSKYLIENYEVDYAYSASTFTASMNRTRSASGSQSTSVFVVADPSYGSWQRFDAGGKNDSWIPPLPDTLVEANRIKDAFPQARVLSQEKAQELEVRKQLGSFDYVHFATHALIFDDEPFLSALVLAAPDQNKPQDGFLTARELMDLKLNADLVVLSACDTGEGQRRDSEGIIGLGWALFVAGSPTQVLTQWEVNDSSTAGLIGDFYSELRSGKSKGAALQAAVRKALDNPRTRHPYYWAPFFLIGDYR